MLILSLVLTGIAALGPTSTAVCDSTSNLINPCTATNTGSSVEIGGSYSGGGGGGGNDRGGEQGGGGIRPEAPAPAPAPPCNPVVGCRGGYEVWTPPEVTISDLASFTPARPSFSGEPAGIAVRGMSANFVASASEQHLTGELFDLPVTVRFVPASFVFDYGDGTARTSASGGASWAELGQAQFTHTSTSHAYRERGMFTASVTVRYTAAVDFGSGAWREVPGYVEATAGAYGVRVVEVLTALVDRTCIEDPTGPGC